MPADDEKTLFGEINYRNQQARFGIKTDDRRRHMYVIGKTGMGKSKMILTLAIQDIQNGHGLAFIDPHGDTVEELLDFIPEERIKDVIYINPADLNFPIAFNVMEQVDPDKRHLVADGVMNVFKKIWVDVWSPRMEYILNNCILALLETPDATLLGINRIFADKDYRHFVVNQLKDPIVKAFWTQEFAKYQEKFATEATAAIQNKVGQFTASSLIRNIVGQPKSTLDMRQIMDSQKILIVNISKGRVGEDASRLLGALIITKLQLAAMSRVDVPERDRKDFILYVDEFQNFATASFANILSEARKYHLSLVIAHQYVAQMDETVSDAVFGNVGTIVAFRVGAEDAELLEKELAPEFLATDIVNLGKRQIYLKLMIDGVASKAFSARTIDTPSPLPVSNREKIIEFSRQRYSAAAQDVEKSIAEWSGTVFGQPAVPADRPRPMRDIFPASGGAPPRRDFSPNRQPDTFPPRPVLPRPSGPASSNADRRPSYPPAPVPLKDVLPGGAVDFRGQKIEDKTKQPSRLDSARQAGPVPALPSQSGWAKPQPKPQVKLEDLRQILNKAIKKDDQSP